MTGWRKGQINLLMAGRRTGKSVWAQMVQDLTLPDINLITSSEVDGKIWYTVQLSMPARQWLTEQDTSQWYEHIGDRNWQQNWFDVHENLYTMLMLKWK